jgi:hypothetical protein
MTTRHEGEDARSIRLSAEARDVPLDERWGHVRALLAQATEAAHYEAYCLARAAGSSDHAEALRRYVRAHPGLRLEYDWSDGGYASAKAEHGRKVGRNVSVMAAANALGADYHTVYHEVWQAQLAANARRHTHNRAPRNTLSPSRGVWPRTIERVMKDRGWTRQGCTELGERVELDLAELPGEGRLLVKLHRKFVAVVDGVFVHHEDPRRVWAGWAPMVYSVFCEPGLEPVWPRGLMNP